MLWASACPQPWPPPSSPCHRPGTPIRSQTQPRLPPHRGHSTGAPRGAPIAFWLFPLRPWHHDVSGGLEGRHARRRQLAGRGGCAGRLPLWAWLSVGTSGPCYGVCGYFSGAVIADGGGHGGAGPLGQPEGGPRADEDGVEHWEGTLRWRTAIRCFSLLHSCVYRGGGSAQGRTGDIGLFYFFRPVGCVPTRLLCCCTAEAVSSSSVSDGHDPCVSSQEVTRAYGTPTPLCVRHSYALTMIATVPGILLPPHPLFSTTRFAKP